MNCTLEIPSTIPYFCEPSEKCGLEVALERVRTSYTMVGLTEEMELTIAAFEVLLPHFFRGASAAHKALNRSRVTSVVNPLTNTWMNGYVSSTARGHIARRAANYHDELKFYSEVKRLFWRRVVELRLMRRR